MRNSKIFVQLCKKTDQHTEQTRVMCIRCKSKCKTKPKKLLNAGNVTKELFKESENKTVRHVFMYLKIICKKNYFVK